MEWGWLFSADLLAAAPPDGGPELAAMLDRARRAATFTFPDGALLVMGERQVEEAWPFHLAMRRRAGEEGVRTADHKCVHSCEVPLFHADAFGVRITMDFWDLCGMGDKADESVVSFRLARDLASLTVVIEFFRQPKRDVFEAVAARVRSIFDPLAGDGLAGEGGIALLSPAELTGPKEVRLTVDASRTGMFTLTWLMYQLYAMRDIWPVRDIWDETTAAGIDDAAMPRT